MLFRIVFKISSKMSAKSMLVTNFGDIFLLQQALSTPMLPSVHLRLIKTQKANPKCLNMGGLIETCEIDELEIFIEGGFSDVSIEDISQDIRQISTGNIIFI